MNAEALYRTGREEPSAWFCGQCRQIRANQDAAEACCRPKMCEDCTTAEVEKGWTICAACRRSRAEERERARFAAARQVTAAEYTMGTVYVEAVERYMDLDEFLNWDDYGNEGPAPAYAYGTETIPFHIHAESIVENALEDHHDDAEVSTWRIEALQGILDEWTAEAGVSSYGVDYTVVVMAEEGA